MLFLRYYLWIAPHLLLCVILLLALRRKLLGELPIFFSLIAVDIGLHFIGLLIVSLFFPIYVYQWGNVVAQTLSVLLEFGVLYELVRKLVLPRFVWPRITLTLLQGSFAVLLLIAATVSAYFTGPGLDRAMRVFQTLDFSSNLIKVGLLLVLVIFTDVLGVSWKTLPAGIALGFGLSGAAEILVSPLLGKIGYVPIDLIRMGAFHVCALVWLIYIGRPERSKFTGTNPSESQLKLWNQELEKLVRL